VRKPGCRIRQGEVVTKKRGGKGDLHISEVPQKEEEPAYGEKPGKGTIPTEESVKGSRELRLRGKLHRLREKGREVKIKKYRNKKIKKIGHEAMIESSQRDPCRPNRGGHKYRGLEQ